jgi:cell wall-associated NlpC family hydrolase
MRVYADTFNIGLPRTTYHQVRTGKAIRYVRDLQAGDLVFFRIPGKGRHVGIYLNNGYFSHASFTRGVTTSNISDPYWRKYLWAARRIIDLESSKGYYGYNWKPNAPF